MGDDTRPRKQHHLGIYDTDAFFVQTMVGFVREAFLDQATAVAMLPARDRDRVTAGIAEAGIDVDAARKDGRLVTIDSDGLADQLTESGAVDRERFATLVGQFFGVAAAPGRALRVCGDVNSALWRRGDLELALEMEDLWNGLPDTPTFELFCLYASAVFRDGGDDDPFIALCQRHVVVHPVENYASLVDPTVPDRTVVLLTHQQRAGLSDRRDLTDRLREAQAALDASVRHVSDQREQYERAVATRDLIGQAKGIIMVRWHIDSDTAFEMLRSAARRSRRKLRDVAQAVVEQQLRRN